MEFANSIREVNETLFAASVPMKKEAEASVLPAHFENGGDKSGTRGFSRHGGRTKNPRGGEAPAYGGRQSTMMPCDREARTNNR